MSFLSNVKYNYQKNSLIGLAKDSDKDKLKKFLNDLGLSSRETKIKLIIECFAELEKIDEEAHLFNNNLIWINGFHQKETELITFFLKFYLMQNKEFNFQISSYASSLTEIFNENISFDYLLNNSFAAQYLISIQQDYYFLTNHSAFFVSENAKRLFAHKILQIIIFIY